MQDSYEGYVGTYSTIAGIGNRLHRDDQPHPKSAPTVTYLVGLASMGGKNETIFKQGVRSRSGLVLYNSLQQYDMITRNRDFFQNYEKSVEYAKNQSKKLYLDSMNIYYDSMNIDFKGERYSRSLPRSVLETKIVVGDEGCGPYTGDYINKPKRSIKAFDMQKLSLDMEGNVSDTLEPPMPIKQNSDPSSYFEIESGETSEHLDESPITYNDIHATITTPHHPPFAPPVDNTQRRQLEHYIAKENNVKLTDNFHDYMEEMMARWRPGNSQFNIEAAMNGNHPYQQDSFELKKKVAKFKPYNPFITFKGWINEKVAIPDLENLPHDVRNTNLSRIITEEVVFPMPDIAKRINEIDFKSNSSNSILPRPLRENEPRGSGSKLKQNPLTCSEPSPIERPSYTPKALPYNDFDLNFETKGCVSGHRLEHGTDTIIDSMDEDVQNLLNGFDNFLFECFRSFRHLLHSGKACTNRS